MNGFVALPLAALLLAARSESAAPTATSADLTPSPAAFEGGGHQAASGSVAKDALGFRDDPSSNTPSFRSFGDVTYRFSYNGNNPCDAGQTLIFVFRCAAPPQESMWDESWGSTT